MPKQSRKVTNSLSKVNKSIVKYTKSARRRMKRKLMRELENESKSNEPSVKAENVVGSSFSGAAAESIAVPNAVDLKPTLESFTISNGHAVALSPQSQSNGTTEQSFFFNRDIPALFNRLCYSEEVLSSLPNRSWAIHSTEIPEKRLVVCSMLMHNFHGRGLEPLYIKQIVFDERLNFDLFLINSRVVLKDKPTTIATMHDFEDLVDYVESLKLCSGGPAVSRYSKVNPECAYKDPLSKWRHNLCSLEISAGDMCDSCQSLEDVLRRHTQRTKPPGKLRTSVISPKRKQRSRD